MPDTADTGRKKPKKRKKRVRNLTQKTTPKFVVVKQGRWFVVRKFTVIRDGRKAAKQIWRRCDPETPEQAKYLATEIKQQFDRLRYTASRPPATFNDAADAFERVELVEATYDAQGRKTSGRRSLVGPRIVLKTLRSRFGDAPLENISFGDIEDFKYSRLRTPIRSKHKTRPRTVRAVNFELSLLRQVFNFAKRRRWLDRSPFEDGRGLIDTASENRRYLTWTRDEERAALKLCTGTSEHLKPFIVLCVDAGLRPGEALAAKWSDVDMTNGFMTVRSYKGRNLQTRRVALSKRLLEILTKWKRTQKEYFARVTPDRSRVIGFASVKGAWQRIAADIGRPELRAHDLRHCFATRLADAGVPLHHISKALGHASLQTSQIYINPQPRELESVVNAIDKLNESP